MTDFALHPLVGIVVLAAVLAFAFTMLLKSVLKALVQPEPIWHDTVLRVASLVVGALVGAAGILVLGEYPWYLTVLVGAGAGSQATVIVEAAKRWIMK